MGKSKDMPAAVPCQGYTPAHMWPRTAFDSINSGGNAEHALISLLMAAYTVLRFDSPQPVEARKEQFLKFAATVSDRFETATKPNA